jgi:hypothetical protein
LRGVIDSVKSAVGSSSSTQIVGTANTMTGGDDAESLEATSVGTHDFSSLAFDPTMGWLTPDGRPAA